MEDDLSISRPGHCAYLGSLLWERTLPYNEIEYVDLDEFLLENGLPPSPAHQPFSPGSQPTASPSSGVVVDLSRPASCASSSSVCSSSGEGLVGSDYDHHCSKTGKWCRTAGVRVVQENREVLVADTCAFWHHLSGGGSQRSCENIH